MGIIGRIGWETLWQVSHVAKWEIFPFLQDRVKIHMERVYILLRLRYLYSFQFANLTRIRIWHKTDRGKCVSLSAFYRAALLCSLGFFAVDPFTEAKQTTTTEQKNSNPLSDYKDILMGKGRAVGAMRWATATYGFYTLHTTFYVNTVQYYFIYTLNIPVQELQLAWLCLQSLLYCVTCLVYQYGDICSARATKRIACSLVILALEC